MARPYRIELAGGFFHVASRGNARQAIFLDDRDRTSFLRVLREQITRFGWRCPAFCLMGNHFHLLLQTPRPNLSDGMRDLKSQYARRFHAEHGTDGALFRPRFWSQLVADDDYLLATSRYIALNPVRAGLVERAEDWPWNSFGDLITGSDRHRVLDPAPLLERLHPDPDVARSRYAGLVADGTGLPPYDSGAPIAGSVDFVREQAPATRPADPVLKAAWEQGRPELSELMARLPESAFIRHARLDLRYTIAEIAAALGCSRETVRRRLRAHDTRT
ncbi:MAG TPA: transposase [Kofleriaceae bacterium]|nr:transposase [Kofleriaceae bacterium]